MTTLLKDFRTRTFSTAKQLPNVKVSTLRLAEAKAEGFQTTESYQTHLAGLDLNSHMLQDSDSLVWLTNKNLDSYFNNHADLATIFRGFNLDYKTTETTNWEEPSDFFPLTDEEHIYLDIDNVEFVNNWSFEFLTTALVNGKKHFVVTWCEYFSGDDHEDHSPVFIKEQNSLLRYPLLYAAQKLNGKLQWSEEPSWQNGDEGDYQIHLFVPFDEIIGKVDGAKGYMDAVSEVIKHFTDPIK